MNFSKSDKYFCITLMSLLAAAVIIAVVYKYMNKREGFVGVPIPPNAHMMLPKVTPAQIEQVKKTVKNTIDERPEVISALTEILTDSAINPTVLKMLGIPSPDYSSNDSGNSEDE
jgi:hypothetical protein